MAGHSGGWDTVYPGAVHRFDDAPAPVRTLRGLAHTPDGSGMAQIGGDPAAAADARRRVDRFLATLAR